MDILSSRPTARLREDFLGWNFGMLIHFNVATFHERQWATGYEDPATFESRYPSPSCSGRKH